MTGGWDLIVHLGWLAAVIYPLTRRREILDSGARPWIVNSAIVLWEWAMCGPLFGHPLL